MPKPPDKTVREAVIEKYLVRQVRLLQVGYGRKAVIKKISGQGWRGWPDRVIFFEAAPELDNPTPACTHWLEVKRPKGGRFEPLQLRNHKMLRNMGFVVRVVNTPELVNGYIADILRFGPHGVPLV